MSDGPDGNKTVFRPSPLQALKGRGPAAGSPPAPPPGYPPAPAGYHPPSPGYPPAPPGASYPPPPAGGYAPPPLAGHDVPPSLSPAAHVPQAAFRPPADDDVPEPKTPQATRNLMLTKAAPLLALAAAARSGRARLELPRLHREVTQAIAAFDRAIQPRYPEEARQRAKYALCATVDDIAQNLPNLGTDGAEWARRSLVVAFFQENIGGDRFWQLSDDMLRSPQQHADLIELFHACLAAGFEGRFRIMPDGQRRLHEVMSRLHNALDHVRSLSPVEMSPAWKGEDAPLAKVGFWTWVSAAGAAALLLLLAVFIVLRLMLMECGQAPARELAAIAPDAPLRLSRTAAAPPPAPVAALQAQTLRAFLAPEIGRREVTVEEDAATVRVRTTTGTLFRSGSDELEPGRAELFARIGKAVQTQQGPVTVEGHADSDAIASLTFPDNTSLSQARADKVAGIIRGELTDPARVSSKGMGDTVPLASNDTAEGKARNRRVEVIVPRRD